MALVSYEYDSESENDDEAIESNVKIKSNPLAPARESNIPSSGVDMFKHTTNALFENLPHTKNIKDITEEQIEDFIPKSKPISKDKQKVKITIPSLSDFNDVEDYEPHAKKQKQTVKGSGLMSLLPPVKRSVTTAKSFIPKVLNQKRNPPKSSTLVPRTVKENIKRNQTETQRKIQQENNGSDDDVETPETYDDEMWEKICGRPKPKLITRDPELSYGETIDIAPEPEKPYDGLDNQAFKELVGKTKRPIGNIKLIDIHEEEILLEKDIWMAKSLTDPEMAPKPKAEDDAVDPTRRKKHHITYLAQQAKANEQELQNAWAASKNNRMASRAKYGF